MTQRKNDQQPMTDEEYAEFQQLQHFDAASLRALALWLNTKKKNRELMKAVSAEMGRNARHLARAVDYFKPYFTEQEAYSCLSANQYLMLFEYAKLKREDAAVQFHDHKFSYTLFKLRDIVTEAKRNGKPASKKAATPEQTVKEVVAILCAPYPDGDYHVEFFNGIRNLRNKLMDIPEIKSRIDAALSRSGNGEAKA